MDVRELKQIIISKGDSPFVDFSKCTTELTDSVFQSICSFLNKEGGVLIVGVHDYGEIVGVAELFIDNMLKKFSNAMEEDFFPSLDLTPEIVEINKRKVLYIAIPKRADVYRYKNKVYDRVGCEVCDITYSYNLVRNLFLRKHNESSENIICPFLRMSELDEMAFRVMRKHLVDTNPNHPWLNLTNEEFLHANGFWGQDPVSKKEGFALATVLLFGKEETIQNYNPVTYRTDAIYRNIPYDDFSHPASDYPESRYDDRDIIFSNLIDSYARLTKFIQRNLPKRVLNKSGLSINIREKLFNEIISNLLVHREYTHKYPCRLLIFSDKLITENGMRSYGHIPSETKKTFDSFNVRRINPLITKVFQEMRWIEKPGSGKQNIFKYAPFYDKGYEVEVEIQNAERFVFSISYGNEEGLDDLNLLISPPAYFPERTYHPFPSSPPKNEWPVYNTPLSDVCPTIDISYVDKAENILKACVKPLPIQDMMRIAKQSNRTRFRKNIIRPLLEEGLLAMRIPTKPSSPLQKYFTTEKGKKVL
ncbi:MAG: putative DNA binding domain-containing protein [Tannerellaceae bacterium]|jgi:ATP-dependent DNA helicase RecG|nr:putative DNA binding domain-containing protein [Tannerellaceae bacterium]